MRQATEEHTSCHDLLRAATQKLEEAGVCRPHWTAEQLLSHRLKLHPVELYLDSHPLSSFQEEEFHRDVADRARGIPLQYLLGSASFYGREFEVGPGVFIPRPETEILVEVALRLLANGSFGSVAGLPVVVDVGTGCGAIGITLSLEFGQCTLTGIDPSAEALSFAHRNALRYQTPMALVQADLVEPLSLQSVDMIVANLPYLNWRAASSGPRELDWEPFSALDGGEGGLKVIRGLIQKAPRVLRPKGILLLEIGDSQGTSIVSFAKDHGFTLKEVVRDLSRMERVVVLWRG